MNDLRTYLYGHLPVIIGHLWQKNLSILFSFIHGYPHTKILNIDLSLIKFEIYSLFLDKVRKKNNKFFLVAANQHFNEIKATFKLDK